MDEETFHHANNNWENSRSSEKLVLSWANLFKWNNSVWPSFRLQEIQRVREKISRYFNLSPWGKRHILLTLWTRESAKWNLRETGEQFLFPLEAGWRSSRDKKTSFPAFILFEWCLVHWNVEQNQATRELQPICPLNFPRSLRLVLLEWNCVFRSSSSHHKWLEHSTKSRRWILKRSS